MEQNLSRLQVPRVRRVYLEVLGVDGERWFNYLLSTEVDIAQICSSAHHDSLAPTLST